MNGSISLCPGWCGWRNWKLSKMLQSLLSGIPIPYQYEWPVFIMHWREIREMQCPLYAIYILHPFLKFEEEWMIICSCKTRKQLLAFRACLTAVEGQEHWLLCIKSWKPEPKTEINILRSFNFGKEAICWFLQFLKEVTFKTSIIFFVIAMSHRSLQFFKDITTF